MAIGRISGEMLKADLARTTDLSFKTDLLYLDVTLDRIGINNASPGHSLSVVGNAAIGNLVFDTNTISSSDANGNIILDPNGTGLVTVAGSEAFIPPIGNTAARPASPSEGMLRYNNETKDLEVYDGTAWLSTGPNVGTAVLDTFSGNDVLQLFTLSVQTQTNNTFVTINGAVQHPGVAYTVTGDALTFTEAPATGDEIQVRTFQPNLQIINIIADADSTTKIQMEETLAEEIIRFDTAGVERMVISATGKVGIANPSPVYDLDVTGDINFTGTFRDNGTPVSFTSNWFATGSDLFYDLGDIMIGINAAPDAGINLQVKTAQSTVKIQSTTDTNAAEVQFFATDTGAVANNYSLGAGITGDGLFELYDIDNTRAAYRFDKVNSTHDWFIAATSKLDLSATGLNVVNTLISADLTVTNKITTDTNANVVIGSAALATTATDGFLYITSVPGVPTGVPTSFSGRTPLVYDSTNDNLYVYNAGWELGGVSTIGELTDVVSSAPAAGHILVYDGVDSYDNQVSSITLSGDVTGTANMDASGDVAIGVTIAPNSVNLTTDTVGNYVETVAAGAGITIAEGDSEGATKTVVNAGVTSLIATTNETTVSGATGAVTIGLPDDVTIGSDLIVTDTLVNTDKLTTDANANVVIGSGAIATTANDGFLYITSTAGVPTGTPTTFTGRTAMVFDTVGNDLYVFDGSWITTGDILAAEQLELTALDELAAGMVAKTADATYLPRTITGTANEIDVADGDGVSGNPTLSIATLQTKSFTDSIAATGTTQGAGTALTTQVNRVTSITAASAEAVVLPTAIAGLEIMVINASGGDPLKIFPVSGGDLGQGTDTVDADLTNGNFRRYMGISATVWIVA